jgi:hypothetical protein
MLAPAVMAEFGLSGSKTREENLKIVADLLHKDTYHHEVHHLVLLMSDILMKMTTVPR